MRGEERKKVVDKMRVADGMLGTSTSTTGNKGEGRKRIHKEVIDEALARMVAQNDVVKAQVTAISHGSEYFRGYVFLRFISF